MEIAPPPIGWRRAVQLTLCILVSLAAGAVYYWRDDIFERLVDPAIPYLLFKPPPAPDYLNPTSWALLPAHPQAPSPSPAVDIFFVHPTTFDAGRWNDAIDDRRSADFLSQVMIPNYAGPFGHVGRVFAPRYRQANLYSMLTLREDAREARAFAYGDVLAAFETYMRLYNSGRPFIIVGVEQGGALAERLARDEVASRPDRLKRLAALYVVEAAAAAADHEKGAPIPACTERRQAQCIVSYLTREPGQGRATHRLLRRQAVWQGDLLEPLESQAPLCVNPLLGAATSDPAPRRSNLGAANASGLEWGVEPGFLSDQVSAECIDGQLFVSHPKSPSLRRGRSWAERNRVQPYNLFYADLEADAKARVAALAEGRRAP